MKGNQTHIVKKRAKMRFSKWRNDWVSFCHEVFGVVLDKEQQEIVRAAQFNKRVSVRSGTARGKDFVSACIALCFLYLTPKWKRHKSGKLELVENTKVALTAPTGRQIDNIMMPEIGRLFERALTRGYQLPGKLLESEIKLAEKEWFLVGFKADEHKHEAWSGFHAVNTMFVVTEATGISNGTFDAIEGNLQGNSRIVLVFNPNITTGYAADTQKDPRWVRFKLSSLTAPNVIHKKNIIQGQVDYEWVLDKVQNWCQPIRKEEMLTSECDFEFEGKYYRPNDVFRIKVLGELPKTDDSVLIPEHWIELAQERWKTYTEHLSSNDGIIGVDVAGMGRDSSTFVRRYGNYVADIEKHNSGGKADHMAVVGKVWHELARTSGCVASIDTIGEGAGVYSRLIEKCAEDSSVIEEQIVSCKFSSSPKDTYGSELTDITGQYKFQNMRAYLFWAVRDWLNPDNETQAMLPTSDTLAKEASEIRWKFNSNGKIMIEGKEDIKARLGHSTDEFDALANTFHPLAIENVGAEYVANSYDDNIDDIIY